MITPIGRGFVVIGTIHACIVTLLTFAALQQGKSHSASGQRNRTAHVGQAQTATPPSGQNQHAPDVREIRADTHKNETNKKETHLSDWIVALSAFVQAAAAVVMAGFTWTLLKYTRRSWKVGARTARAAKRSADAAKDSAALARDTLQLTQRAFIGVGTFAFNQCSAEQRPTIFQCLFSNNGNTVASLHKFVLMSAMLDRPLPDKPVYDSPRDDFGGAPLAPSHTMAQRVTLTDVSAQSFKAVLNGTGNWWLWGYIEYSDVFGLSHRTGFCVRLIPQTKDLVLGGPSGYNYAT